MKLLKLLFGLILSCFLMVASVAQNEPPPKGVTLIQLLARPEAFDSKVVTVRGFLKITHEPHHPILIDLYLHEEDAKNLLPNGVLVIPSDEMLHNQERISGVYVVLTGTFHAVRVPGEQAPSTGVIKDVRSCNFWSNPNRPIGTEK